MGKCKFSEGWLVNPKYKAWLDKDPKWQNKARCKFCVKSFDISNMGDYKPYARAKAPLFCDSIFCTRSHNFFNPNQRETKNDHNKQWTRQRTEWWKVRIWACQSTFQMTNASWKSRKLMNLS